MIEQANFQHEDQRVNNSTAGRPPGLSLSEEDKVRVKLRESRRKFQIGVEGPTDLITLPGVAGLTYALRYIEGGRNRFVEYVQMAVLENMPNAVAWFRVFAELTSYERTLVSFDDVCAAAAVKPSKLMSEVISCAMDLGRDMGNLVAAATHPEVIAKMTESAKRIDGDYAEIAQKDRHAFLQGMGVLPTPKAMSISVSTSANARAAAAAAQESSVPSFGQTLRAAQQVHEQAARPALPAASDINLPFLNTPAVVAEEAVLIGGNPDDEDEG